MLKQIEYFMAQNPLWITKEWKARVAKCNAKKFKFEEIVQVSEVRWKIIQKEIVVDIKEFTQCDLARMVSI